MLDRHRAAGRVLAATAVAVLAAGLTSCVPPADAGIGCAWGTKADGSTFNVAYPDATATYFGTRYTLLSGQRLVLSGTYPYARYFSLHTYNLQGNAVDHLPDVGIAPDPGSDNPFIDTAASGDPTERRWTVTIGSDAPTADGDNLMTTPVVGSVLLRVYVPDDAADPAGGVPLPALSVRNVDGSVRSLPVCGNQTPDPAALDLINAFGPATDIPPSSPPVFRRPLNVAGLYPNRDNAYLASIVSHTPGEVVVVRGRAPSTPDTQSGVSPATPAQLRYWSFCTNEYRKPYPVSSCVIDADTALDAGGAYTIVVSTPQDRPANATEANGVTWVDWGSTSVNMLMAFRHMLPADDFTENVFNVAPGQAASEVMGPYTPSATDCPVATFEAGGAAACGL